MSTNDVAAAPAPGPRRPTLLNVQALRGAAAFTVVFAHLSSDGFEGRLFGSSWIPWANLPANTGVDLFFVISGLIMVVTTWHGFDAPGSARRFLLRRIARIYPLYWLFNTAMLALLVLRPQSARFADGSSPDVLGSYLLLPHEGRLPVLVAWSLVYEMYFYLLFAAAMLLGRRWFGWVIGGWAAATLVLHGLVGGNDPMASSGTGDALLNLVASPLSLEFVFGVGIGYALLRGWVFRPRAVLAVGITAWVGVLVLLGGSGWTAFPSDLFRALVPGVAATVLVYGAVAVEIARGTVSWRPLQRLGDASYSLYLVHVPALTLLADVVLHLGSPGPALHAVALVLVPGYVVVLALVCHRVLERPLQLFFQRRLARRPAPADAGSRPAVGVGPPAPGAGAQDSATGSA